MCIVSRLLDEGWAADVCCTGVFRLSLFARGFRGGQGRYGEETREVGASGKQGSGGITAKGVYLIRGTWLEKVLGVAGSRRYTGTRVLR